MKRRAGDAFAGAFPASKLNLLSGGRESRTVRSRIESKRLPF
jgi:hypothetical protein